MKKVLLLILAGGLLAGCYHTPETQAAEKNTVVYDDSGFTPKAITVKVGTAVTWKNNGTKMMWMASAVHPTHQELPGFDQLEATGNGTSYSYNFTKQGTWKYHNHVAPGDTGTVVVEE
jgi:plastocyanin